MAVGREPDVPPGSGREPGPQAAAPARAGSLRQRIFSLPALVSLLVAGGFLLFMVTRFDIDLSVTWQQARGANPWLLIAAFAVHYTTFVFRGARWRMLLRRAAIRDDRDDRDDREEKTVPGVLYCSQLVLLGWFVNSIGWLRLGDAFRAYLYQEEYEASFSGAIGTILAERVLDAALVALILLIAAPFLVGGGDDGLAWAVLGVAVALAAALVAVLAAMVWAQALLLRWLPGWLATHYRRFHDGAMGSTHRLPQTTALGALGWAAEMGRMYLVAMALGFELSAALAVFLTLANSLLSLVPTPGGVGAVESGVAGLAVRLAALAKEAATALVLVDRFITYISVIIVGAVIFALRPLFRRRARNAPPLRQAQNKHAPLRKERG